MTRAARAAWLLPALAIVGAVALHLPALATGFYADDFMHQLALEGRLPLQPWALYDFGGTAEWSHLQDDVGGFPWWTSPDWKVRFFRPLTSVTLWADHAVWGAGAAGYHVTNLLWLAALLVAAYALYRGLGLTRGASTGAVALLGASQATVLPVSWIANRNSLLAAFFTVAAVAAATRHRAWGIPRAAAAALALALLAALSKESGVVAFVLVAAYFLVHRDLDSAKPSARRWAAGSVALGAAYILALAAAGYGTRSLFYATPWTDPLRYLGNLGLLASVAPLSLLTPVAADLVAVSPGAVVPAVGVSLVLLVVVGAWMARRLRGEPSALLLAVWVVVALLPEASAPLSERLLLSSTVGASGLLALLISRTLPRAERRPGWERALAVALLALVGVLESAVALLTGAWFAGMAGAVRDRAPTADVGPPGLGRREVLVVQSDDPLLVFALPTTWAFVTRDLDLHFSMLQFGRRSVRWTRDDARTMTFESLGAPFGTGLFESVYRSREGDLPAGQLVAMPAYDLEIVATAEGGGVRTVRLRWREPPEGERYRFLVPREGSLVDVEPPAVGETRVLPEAPRANPFAP